MGRRVTTRKGPAGTVRIEDTDRGYQKLLHELGRGSPRAVKVGIMGAKANERKRNTSGGVDSNDSVRTVAEVASYHEFGQGNAPRRSMLGDFVDHNRERLNKDLATVIQQMVRGQITRDQALERFGLHVVGLLQMRMSMGIPPPLKDETVERKLASGAGGSTPLIASGQLRSSWTHEVVR